MGQQHTFIGFKPGAVHNGHGEGAVRYMLVMKPHYQFTDPPGDMHFADPSSRITRPGFVQQDLNKRSFFNASWPYTVTRSTLTNWNGTAKQFMFVIMPPGEKPLDVVLDGRKRRLEPDCLLAIRPKCAYRFAAVHTYAYVFLLADNWERRLTALAYQP